ncbi:uncharacterized protein LOC131935821 [Physella acuta]|uniref:uncharacterized protein LOC131935821 n=1 Tax=Physella acuta TaxID=109671 RepID=UPI0027DAE7EF|nr:uncharacterized protein LOC131935821 [Physella acuta]
MSDQTHCVDFVKIAEVDRKKRNIPGTVKLNNLKMKISKVDWLNVKEKQNTTNKPPGLYLKLQTVAWAGAIETFKLPLTNLPGEVITSLGGETISVKNNNKPELFVPVEKKSSAKCFSGDFSFEPAVSGCVLVVDESSVEQQELAQIVSDLSGDPSVKDLTVNRADGGLPLSVTWKISGQFEFYAS